MSLPGGVFWRTISSEEVQLAAAIFAFVHRDCGDELVINRDEGLMSCWCGRCEDVRTYEIVEVPTRSEGDEILPQG